MKALISPQENYRIAEITSVEFPVAPPLFWIDCPNECGPDWEYKDGLFVPPVDHYIELSEAEKLAYIRTERNLRLQASDFTQLEDIRVLNGPELTALWVQYRQELRDMLNNSLDLDSPKYPVPPV